MGPGAQAELSPRSWTNCSWGADLVGACRNLTATSTSPRKPPFAWWCPPPHLCAYRKRQTTALSGCCCQPRHSLPVLLGTDGCPVPHTHTRNWLGNHRTGRANCPPSPPKEPHSPFPISAPTETHSCSAPSRSTQGSRFLVPPWASISPSGTQDKYREKTPSPTPSVGPANTY